MFKFASLLSLAVLATRVAGHGAVTSYVINGQSYAGYTGFSPATSPQTIEWQWPDYNPTLDPSLTQVRCNGGTSAQLVASVPAGGKVTAQWAQWTHAQGSISVYLYNCGSSFSSCVPTGNGWFKIDEAGLLSGTMYDGTWGAGEVMNTLSWTSTIPASLVAGNYLIRHELIAVHQSNTPQFYAECAQLSVTGGGSAAPSGSYLTSIPGYCKLSDSNVSFDIYSDAAKTITTWDVPGPPVWPNGSVSTPSSSAVSPPPSSSSSSSKPVSSASSTKPVTTSSSKTTSANTTGQTLYGQCGGQGWTGPTTCSSGTCKVSNAYYSQCLP